MVWQTFSLGAFVRRESTMVFDPIFEPFIEASPVSVMFPGTLQNLLSAARLIDYSPIRPKGSTCTS